MKSALGVPQHEPVTEAFEDAEAMVLEERRVIVQEMAWKLNIVQGCTTALGSTRCVQDGFPGNCQRSLSTLLWTFASVTWNVITAK